MRCPSLTAVALIAAAGMAGADCPPEARARLDRARAAYGDTAAEARLYGEAARLAPTCAEAHNGLGDVLEREGRLEEALAAYTRAAALDARFATPRFGIGDVLVKLGRRPEALAAYRQGLALDPTDASARTRVAELEQDGAARVIPAAEIQRTLARTTRGIGVRPAVTFGENLVPFDLDSAEIRSDARAQLDELGRALAGLAGDEGRDLVVTNVIRVLGHTDVRGSAEYNRSLSERRARAVVDYLERTAALPPGLLEAVGLGEAQPVCSEETDACHSRNRRVEVQREKR